MYYTFFIHSPIDGHLGWFHVLAIVKCCREHWGACAFVNSGFLRLYVQEWGCWSYGSSGFGFLRKLHTVCHSGHTNSHSTNSARGSLFPMPSLALIVRRFFDDGHSGLVISKDIRLTVVVQLLSCVQLFVTPWTVAHQAPLSMGFPRQEYWSG